MLKSNRQNFRRGHQGPGHASRRVATKGGESANKKHSRKEEAERHHQLKKKQCGKGFHELTLVPGGETNYHRFHLPRKNPWKPSRSDGRACRRSGNNKNAIRKVERGSMRIDKKQGKIGPGKAFEANSPPRMQAALSGTIAEKGGRWLQYIRCGRRSQLGLIRNQVQASQPKGSSDHARQRGNHMKKRRNAILRRDCHDQRMRGKNAQNHLEGAHSI